MKTPRKRTLTPAQMRRKILRRYPLPPPVRPDKYTRHIGRMRWEGLYPRSIRFRFGDPESCVRREVEALRGRFFRSRSEVETAVYGILGRCIGHTDWSTDQIIEWMIARGFLRRVTGFRVPTRL